MPVVAGRFFRRSMRAFRHPLPDECDLRGIEWATLVGHLRDFSVGSGEHLHQEIGQRGATLAAGAYGSGGVELERGFLCGGTVAFDAMLVQQGFDLRGVIHRRVTGGGKDQEWDEGAAEHSKKKHSGVQRYVRQTVASSAFWHSPPQKSRTRAGRVRLDMTG